LFTSRTKIFLPKASGLYFYVVNVKRGGLRLYTINLFCVKNTLNSSAMKDESHAAEASPLFCSQKSDSPSNKYVIQPTAAFAGRTHAHISININLSSSRTALN